MPQNWIYGAQAKRKQRIAKELKIRRKSISEIPKIKPKDLFYMGLMLYWAEGAKQRNTTSQGVDFSNSDPRMCRLFIKWLQEILLIPKSDISLCIYIHVSQINRITDVQKYWSRISGFPVSVFNKTSFSKTVYPRRKKRQNKGVYFGQLRIKVRKSTDLNRKIAGWVEGVCVQTGSSL